MFAQGDFMLAAESAEPDTEVKANALIMAGLLEHGLDHFDLLETPSPQAVLYAAFARWSLGQDGQALAMLASIDDGAAVASAARRLAGVIADPDVRVFVTAAHVPVFTAQSASAWKPLARYGNFTVAHVASQLPENAYPYGLSEPFDEFIDGLPTDEKPDFIFAMTPQWVVPRNFGKAKVPKVIWCHDTDIFLYRAQENLAQYDVKIVMISQEHFELSRTLGGGCVSNIMSSTLCSPFPDVKRVPREDKDIDVLFSGAALTEFTSEKARFVFLMSELAPEYKICVVDGHLDEEKYFQLLERAKFLPIINRYCGCPSPRWRDALCVGTALLYPEHTLYGEIVAGCHPFRAESIAADFRAHIEKFDRGDPRYDPDTMFADATKRFAIHRQSRDEIFLRLLKFAAFCALVTPPPEAVHRNPRNRLVWLTPTIDAWIFGRQNIRDKVLPVAAALHAEPDWDEKDFNNAACAYRKLYATFVEAPEDERAAWRTRAESFLIEGIERFPRSLLLRFNGAHWRYRDSDGADEAAIADFGRIIDNFDEFEFDPMGSDVGIGFPLHEAEPVFPYYDYGQLVLKQAAIEREPSRGTDSRVDPATVLLAAAHGYIGLSKLRAGDRDGAVERIDRALSIYADNLPLLRLRLQALASAADDPAHTAKLIDAFFECANKWPVVVLTDIDLAVRALAATNRFGELRELLARWYGMSSVVFHPKFHKRVERDLPKIHNLLAFYDFFPSHVLTKMSRLLGGELPLREINQTDRLLEIALLERKIDASRQGTREFVVYGETVQTEPAHEAGASEDTSRRALYDRIHRQEERIHQQEERIRQLEETETELRERARHASEQFETIARHFEAMKNSTIWRSTQPVRSAIDLVRRGTHRARSIIRG